METLVLYQLRTRSVAVIIGGAGVNAMAKPANVTGIWDNGGKTIDRYTVAVEPDVDAPQNTYVPMLGLSVDPASPHGFSQWTKGFPGPQLGSEITWEELPEDVRAHVAARFNAG